MTQEDNLPLSIENSKSNLAPIVLFVYNRPWHTQQTLEALQKNELASESELFIYSDAPKNESATQAVTEIRDYIKTIDGFKSVTIIEREKNWGLANSIIDGVTKIINEYGKIIVLEDDLITSPYFLKFMNEALNFYQDEEKVWHINGWNNPIDPKGLSDIYFGKLSYSWAWATWSNRWIFFNNNADEYIRSFSKKDIHEFNIDGNYNMWSQLIANKKGTLKTWAVFWYAQIFESKGLTVMNNLNLVRCIGTDGSGENCGIDETYSSQELASHLKNIKFLCQIEFDKKAHERLVDFILNKKKSIIKILINKIVRTFR